MATRRVAEGNGNAEDWNIISWLLAFVIMPTVVYHEVEEKLSGRKMAWLEALAHTTVGSVPLGDTAVDTTFHGLEGERHSTVAQVSSTAADDVKLLLGQPVKQPVRSLFDTGGYSGLGMTDQMGIAAQYAWDVEHGQAAPQNAGDVLHGLAEGAPRRASRRGSRGRR